MKLSQQMLNMLEDVHNGFGTHGTALSDGKHAGRYRTARALRSKGLLDYENELTEAGRAALESANQTKGE